MEMKMKMNTQIENIKKELNKTWRAQEAKGFKRLALAYHFFEKCDDSGEMVFSKHCKYVREMRLESDGKEDFQRLIRRKIDFTDYDIDCDAEAEKLANEYFEDQSSRLANYIVRIAPLPVER